VSNLVSYSESSFMLPVSQNWQDIHSLVYQVAMNGEDRKGQRDFIFSVDGDNRLMGDQLLVTVRGGELPTEAQPSVYGLDVTQGQTISLTLILSLLTSINKPDSRKKTTIVQSAPYDDWFAKTMLRAGLKVARFTFSDQPKKVAQKGKSMIFLPSSRFTFTAEIVDLSLFKKAWIEGIGAKRGYGFGMMEIVKDEL